ncbi:hypothetical protein BDC45DRAFT_518542 [Circinella umbellata]|nr:hypothetical protein BDC45DRAFT_518542 [Circinella umbellata]
MIKLYYSILKKKYKQKTKLYLYSFNTMVQKIFVLLVELFPTKFLWLFGTVITVIGTPRSMILIKRMIYLLKFFSIENQFDTMLFVSV